MIKKSIKIIMIMFIVLACLSVPVFAKKTYEQIQEEAARFWKYDNSSKR
jgi:hypothetical protein